MIQSNYSENDIPKIGDKVSIINSYQKTGCKLRGRTGIVRDITSICIVVEIYNMIQYGFSRYDLLKIEL